MKLKNVLIVVKDIGRAARFYHALFGLETVLDNDGNMILTEGLVLQEEKYWKAFLGRDILPENNSSELYFEEWGSCSVSRNVVTFNQYLMKAKPACIDYVVLHELVHLIYPNHSKRFYDFLSIHMPDWEERKRMLDMDVVHGL